MRKILLVAAMVLASASAQAAGPRSLSLASADDPASPQQAAPAPAPQAAETPRYVDRPSPVATTPPAAATTTVPSATTEPSATTPSPRRAARADRPRRRAYWTEGRIIGELHRYGIYW